MQGSGSLRTGNKLPAITPAERDHRAPLSFAQQRLWFLERMGIGNDAYHISFGLRLEGALDTRALRQALDRLVARHESLRTTFVIRNGEPVQRVLPAEDTHFLLTDHDLSFHTDADIELIRLITTQATVPFDLEAGPLLRGCLVRLRENEHVLLISLHHIIFDAWSMQVFLQELSVAYSAFLRGDLDALPDVRMQYVDYAVWQRKWMTNEVLRGEAEYWKTVLDGAPSLLELPTDNPRPKEQDYSGDFAELVIDPDLTTSLKELSRRHNVTLYTTLLAAWGLFLARLSGQQDVVIGTPVANRRLETEGSIGLFLNSLALRLDVSGSPSVAEFLGRVKAQVLSALKHQNIPFEMVVDLVRPVRSLAYNPLFQVMFAWQSGWPERFEFGGLKACFTEPAPQRSAKFDMTLSLQLVGQRIVGGLEYATSLFKRSTIECHLERFLNQLRGMVKGDEQTVDQLPLLTESECHRLLVEWNDTRVDHPNCDCVHERFESQVAERPEATALIFNDATLSYEELNRRSNRLAHYLRELGVRADSLVAICVERGMEMVVALLAVLKAGGAYIPLDPEYPIDRIRFMMEDSKPVVVLTQANLKERLTSRTLAVPVLDLSAPCVPWQNRPEDNLDRDVVGLAPENLAYVIYTSGSTGTPKGVAVEHRNLTNFLWSMQKEPGLDAEDTLLAVTTLSFDIAGLELYLPLMVGAQVKILPREVCSDGFRLRDELDRGITAMQATPTSWRLLLEAGWQGTRRLTLLCGGEALSPDLAQNLVNGSRSSWNMYGPTETTIWSTIEPLTGFKDKVTIGRPIANTRIYILDGKRSLVPIGVVGELYIGGAGVARGYLNRAELTAERFLDDPFNPKGESRMYRTGDLARWLPDGKIEFLGRNDYQLKIRGCRIELGEINARLKEHPGVNQSVVVAQEDTIGSPRLVAYFTPRQTRDASPGADILRKYLSGILPEYMVPAAYVQLDQLPLTPNGKVDHNALPLPDGSAYPSCGYQPPAGEIEIALANIWSDVLRIEGIGRHDNFFELGGHSLQAITLIERMQQQGFALDVRSLFACPTLADLAASAKRKQPQVEASAKSIPAQSEVIAPDMLTLLNLTQEEIDCIVEKVPGGVKNVQDIYPLAPLQEGILFHHLLEGVGDPYLTSSLFRSDTKARLTGYLAATQQVVDRHDILRTAVIWEGVSQPVQVVLRKATLTTEEVLLDPAQDAAVQLYARFDPRKHRIDLQKAPLLRFSIAYDHSNRCWLMMLLLHHMIGDRITLEALQQEVQYFLEGRDSQLPTPLPFRNLVAQARQAVSPEEHESFFQGLLGDVTEPTTPFGLKNVQGDGAGIEEARVVLDKHLAHRLRMRARELGVSTASVFHLAWALVLARASGRDDVVFGTVLSGRMWGGENVGRIMGLFSNTLPLRIQLGNDRLQSSIRKTHTLLADLLRHEHAPLALAQRCSSVPAPLPLFSALLNYRRSPEKSRDHSEAVSTSLEGITWVRGEERTNFPLTLSIDDLSDSFILTAQTPASIGPLRICEFMLAALDGLLEAPSSKAISAVDVLPSIERRRVLYEWNNTKTDFPGDVCLHELFEAQARKTPERTALAYQDKELTYGELNSRANQLAHHLRDLGVRPDTRVAICVERGLDMVIGMLAVLKASGSYVPLDPAYPLERLRFMLKDSAPHVLLTQRHLQGRFPDVDKGLSVLDLSAAIPQWHASSKSNPMRADVGLSPQNLAYVLYTSGSSGAPKGVAIEHRNAVNFICWGQTSFDRAALKCTLFSTSINFDLAVFECFLPLTVGAKVQIVGDVLELASVADKITLVNTVPSAMSALIDAGTVSASIACINLAGEPLKRELVEHIFAATDVNKIHNLYGPTETTTYSTWVAMDREQSFMPHIGRPIANTKVYILNGRGEPAPIGVPGEIHIGGSGVARGYMNRPQLTTERFLHDPFDSDSASRMYKTGDLGRWLPEGNIEFLGRNDFQIKIRGFRVELGEIEARLLEHPNTREALVIAREDQPGDIRLVAYYTCDESAGTHTPETQVLRAHIAKCLPEYMVPAAFVRMDSFPLTPNGKLDRSSLPAPEADASALRSYEPPMTEKETILAGIWAEILKVDRVGRQDNFFSLGGHSLKATQVMSRIGTLLGVKLPLRVLFEEPTIAALAKRISHPIDQSQQGKLPPISSVARDQTFPLSFNQQGRLLGERLASLRGIEPYPFHVRAAFSLVGELDPSTAERALNEIVRRHEILRTGFPEVTTVLTSRFLFPLVDKALSSARAQAMLRRLFRKRAAAESRLVTQKILPSIDLTLPVVDLRDLPAPQKKEQFLALAEEQGSRMFDCARPPLIRACLVRLDDSRHILILIIHHLICDGLSIQVLKREFLALYSSFSRGLPSQLAELPIQFTDFARWQRRVLQGEALRELLIYWSAQTLPYNPTTDRDFQFALPRPKVPSYRAEVHMISVEDELLQKLESACRLKGLTMHMMLFALVNTVLHCETQKPRVGVMTVFANRVQIETEAMIGNFVNSHVLHTDFPTGVTFSEVLKQTRNVLLDADQHQEIPMSLVRASLAEEMDFEVPRYPNASGIVQFVMVGSQPKICSEYLTIEDEPMPKEQYTENALRVLASYEPHRLTLQFIYATDVFDEDGIRGLANGLLYIAGIVANNVEIAIASLNEHYSSGKATHGISHDPVS